MGDRLLASGHTRIDDDIQCNSHPGPNRKRLHGHGWCKALCLLQVYGQSKLVSKSSNDIIITLDYGF